MQLSDWARREGVHSMTAWRWWRAGKLPVPAHQTPSGTISEGASEVALGRMVVYARVSSSDRVRDLDRQVARVTGWATRRGHAMSTVITEIGSGLHGRRRQ